MAEALASSGSDGSNDNQEIGGVDESFRRMCEHYNRGCSFIVSWSCEV